MRDLNLFISLCFTLLLLAGCDDKPKASIKVISTPTRVVVEFNGDAGDIAPFEIESDSTASDGKCVVLPEKWATHGELHPAYITKTGKLISAKKNLMANPIGEPLMPNGSVEAVVNIEDAGQYRIWIRAKFDNSCANSFHLGINTGAPLDKDGDGAFEENTPLVVSGTTYKRWKWYKSAEIAELKAGANSITIYNREDGIRIDQLICVQITEAPTTEYEPQGIESSVE